MNILLCIIVVTIQYVFPFPAHEPLRSTLIDPSSGAGETLMATELARPARKHRRFRFEVTVSLRLGVHSRVCTA